MNTTLSQTSSDVTMPTREEMLDAGWNSKELDDLLYREGRMTDPDIETTVENIPFFMEGLAQRFEGEGCANLPKLCRAVADHHETLLTEGKARQGQLDAIFKLALDALSSAGSGPEFVALNAIYWHARGDAQPDSAQVGQSETVPDTDT